MERGSGSNDRGRDRDWGRDRDMGRRRRSIMQPPKTPETPPSLTGSRARRAQAQAHRTPHCHFVICMKRSCRSDRATKRRGDRQTDASQRPTDPLAVGLSGCPTVALSNVAVAQLTLGGFFSCSCSCECVCMSIYLYMDVCVYMCVFG